MHDSLLCYHSHTVDLGRQEWMESEDQGFRTAPKIQLLDESKQNSIIYSINILLYSLNHI